MQWFLKGKPNGKDIGMFVDGKQNGLGKAISRDGDVYEGTFTNTQRSGFGTFYFSEGSPNINNYSGDWISGKYVVKGWFENNKLTHYCSSEQDCLQQMRSDAQAKSNRLRNRSGAYGVVTSQDNGSIITWGTECASGGVATVQKNRDAPEYYTLGASFEGSTARSVRGISLDEALRRACSGN